VNIKSNPLPLRYFGWHFSNTSRLLREIYITVKQENMTCVVNFVVKCTFNVLYYEIVMSDSRDGLLNVMDSHRDDTSLIHTEAYKHIRVA